jgi:hypothetical protein
MPAPPRNSPVAKSRAQERRGAQVHGGRVTAGSGNQVHAKGDMRTTTSSRGTERTLSSGILWEYKRTDGKSISLKIDWLDKIRREALLDGRRPRLGIELGGKHYVVLPEEDYLELEELASDRLGDG